MLEAFGGSDNPPAVATRTWYVPAAGFGGRRLHGMQGAPRHCLSLPTVSRSRFALSSMSVSPCLSCPCLSVPYRGVD